MQQSHTHITSGVVAKEPFRATLFIAQGGMRAKPDMKPWVSTDKSKMSSFRSGTFSSSICLTSLRFVALHSLVKCCPYGAQKCETIA